MSETEWEVNRVRGWRYSGNLVDPLQRIDCSEWAPKFIPNWLAMNPTAHWPDGVVPYNPADLRSGTRYDPAAHAAAYPGF